MVLLKQLLDDYKKFIPIILIPYILFFISIGLNYLKLEKISNLFGLFSYLFISFGLLIYLLMIFKLDYDRFGYNGFFLNYGNSNNYIFSRFLRYSILSISLLMINILLIFLCLKYFGGFNDIFRVFGAFFVNIYQKMTFETFLIWAFIIIVNLLFFSSISIFVVGITIKLKIGNFFLAFLLNFFLAILFMIVIYIIGSMIPIELSIKNANDLLRWKIGEFTYGTSDNKAFPIFSLQLIVSIIMLIISNMIKRS